MMQLYTCTLTESCAISRCGETPGVAVGKDCDGVSWNSRQNVLRAVVADFFVVVHVSLQHLLNPANHTATGAWPKETGHYKLKMLIPGIQIKGKVPLLSF